ncbi:hypothetical protein DAEQUDRAFT_205393 [Daedalea quercina L-15889]|uniref:Uncharacterized protein n=1 Tax=Daedalea quercina L-15889 TaxID=1314783 RepID=A0A165R866_9APHY|nr:hypothetical protein DAEQUDRAFT_205393 [Daedalea quercina L-15889]
MLKHSLDTPTPPSSPSKRARFEPGASSPVRRYARVSTSDSSPYTRYSFPSSGTSASTPYSIPSDSPSNPFGLQRALLALKLPRSLGYAKHLAFRFQLVYSPPLRDLKGKGKARAGQRGGEGKEGQQNVASALAEELENVYRVAQVPTNYTFRHLHKLILWLFASDARWERPPHAKLPTRHRRSSRLKEQKGQAPDAHRRAGPSHDRKGKGKQVDVDVAPAPRPRPAIGVDVPPSWAGHVFEVRDGVQLYTTKYRPGVIKRDAGRVRVRLSSERDRQLFPDLYGGDAPVGTSSSYASMSGAWDEGEELEGVSMPEASFEADADDESAEDVEGEGGGKQEKDWVWEAEDDYTVGHVWPDGPEKGRGIIYHHLPGVSVHITMNEGKLPPRKGIGNQPYVFRWKGSTRGAIRIAHLSRAPATSPASAPTTSRELARFSEEVFEDETDMDERRLRRWNSADAFKRFLAREEEREHALRRRRAASLPSASAFADTTFSSPPRPRPEDTGARSPLPPSSPPRYSSSPTHPARASSPLAFPLMDSPHAGAGRRMSSPPRCARSSPRVRARTLSYPLSSPGPRGALGAFPLTTPFPAHPLLAKRVRRASRRFERITRSVVKDMEEAAKRKEARRRRKDEERRKDGGGGSGEGGQAGEVLVPDSDTGEDAEGGDAAAGAEEFDGDALFAEDAEDDGDVGDLQSDGFWSAVGGFQEGYSQWIGEGREEDWDPFGEAEL